MEKRYETALKIILKFCEEDGFCLKENIKLICKTVLEESGDDDVRS